jgi:cytidylate kinase
MTVVAIDGPAGAGKSTVARLVAGAIGVPYLDTGAMYRCVALAVLESGLGATDVESVARLARSVEIVLGEGHVLLDGRDVSSRIRDADVGALVSEIATNSGVRDAMRQQQQQWIAGRGCGVVEGRDIGTVVLPDADVKIYLTASPHERAARRVGQNGGDLEVVAREIESRDRIDSSRSDSPLRPADDAVHLDSTGMSIDEVVSAIVGICASKEKERHGRG